MLWLLLFCFLILDGDMNIDALPPRYSFFQGKQLWRINLRDLLTPFVNGKLFMQTSNHFPNPRFCEALLPQWMAPL